MTRGRALNFSVEQDGDLPGLGRKRLGQVAEDFCSFGIQRKRHAVTLLVKVGIGALDVFAGEFRPPLNEQLELLLLSFDAVLVSLYHVPGRHDFLAGLDAGDAVAAAGNRGQLELGHALQFGLGRFDLLGVQSGDLHQDAFAPLWRDYRFAHPIGVTRFLITSTA